MKNVPFFRMTSLEPVPIRLTQQETECIVSELHFEATGSNAIPRMKRAMLTWRCITDKFLLPVEMRNTVGSGKGIICVIFA